jgi:hypothetical protein
VPKTFAGCHKISCTFAYIAVKKSAGQQKEDSGQHRENASVTGEKSYAG